MVSSLFYHKRGFHVAHAETPPCERDRSSDLGIAKMHQRQKFGVRPSLSLIGLDHDMSLMCVCYWSTGRLRVADTFLYFLERLVAQVRPQIFFSRTLEKLGRTCDQIGRTLEPWLQLLCKHSKHAHKMKCRYRISQNTPCLSGSWKHTQDEMHLRN